MTRFLTYKLIAALNDLFVAGECLNTELTAEDKNALREKLNTVESVCDKIHLVKVKGALQPFRDERLAVDRCCTKEQVTSHLETIWLAIIGELKEKTFTFIPAEKANFFENKALFGHAVRQSFDSAKDDIRDAGNCLAADLPVAAVFHLMRVAELGLRQLAKTLRIKLKNEIEFATWGEVIKALDNKLKEIENTQKRTSARDEKLRHYGGLLLDIRAFQHLWGNPVMHVRSRYKYQEAEAAFLHMKDFMQRLAKQK